MSTHFTVSTTCPQCGHSVQTTHDEKTMRAQHGNSPTISVLCARCQTRYEQPTELACAEWDDYCQEIPLPADV
ncbi:MAG: hypothetical protein KBF11_09030 [Desulfomicrobium sp.]|jgi:antirestriction protein|nr:hypothetical protein [Desulfomicrobium sp.]